ncbi:MAG: SusC/RagA family TonB-linked outer membrane protein, partial [Duncaniella sp.]|nr:SusC/RagA family TonB-linked outer membrane protein [Duncaniella sp.]
VKNGSTLNLIREGYYPQAYILRNVEKDPAVNIHMIETARSRYNETTLLPSGKRENDANVAGVQNLNRKDFALGSMNIDRAMKGAFTGLNVIGKGGMTGEGSYLQMRGVKSLFAENSPLLVINGVPFIPDLNESPIIIGYSQSPLKAFNNQDIRNITVLKGADAAQYGSLGSNGVIMIETDQATSNDVNTRISLNAVYGHNWNRSRIPMMNASQYKTYLTDMGLTYYPNQEAFFNDFTFLSDPTVANANLYSYNTDWQDQLFKNSNTVDFLFRVEGGDNIAKYNISLGYMGDNGTMKNTHSNRYNAQVNASVLVSRQIEIQACINAAYLNGQYQQQSLGVEASPLVAALRRSPLLSPYASDMYGNLISNYSSYYYGNIENKDFWTSNPLAIVEKLTSKGRQYDMNSKFHIFYRPTRNLTFSGAVAMYYNYNQEETFIPGMTNKDIVPLHDQYGDAENSVRVGTYHTFNMYYALNGSYNLNLGRGNHMDFLVGYQAMTTDTEYDAAFGRNTNNDFYQTLGDTKPLGRYFSGFNNNWNWMNVYARVDYRMADLLKLGVNASWDGASSIGSDATRMTFYPAADLTFMAAQLPGLRESDFVNKLNLYANYGLTGNSRFSTKLGKYYYTSTPYQTVAGIIRANVPNTHIKAERDLTLNVGLETSLLNNRLQLGAGYYNIDARDVLMAGERSSVFGTSAYFNNDGRLTSKGFEGSIQVMPVNTGDFRWMIGGNITTIKNSVRSLGSLDRIVNDLDEGAQVITRVGGDPYAFYGYRTLGVFSTTAEAQEANLVNRSGTPFQAGDVHYLDLNEDGIINDKDRVELGSATPDFFGSFFTRLEWRNWALDLTFAYSKGNKAYNAVRRLTESGKDFSNQSTALMRRWSMEGQITDIPRAVYGDKVGNNDFSDRWIEDASYVKLRDITVSYTWNKLLLPFFQCGTIYVTGENLITSTKYLGLEPEFYYSHATMLQGV